MGKRSMYCGLVPGLYGGPIFLCPWVLATCSCLLLIHHCASDPQNPGLGAGRVRVGEYGPHAELHTRALGT